MKMINNDEMLIMIMDVITNYGLPLPDSRDLFHPLPLVVACHCLCPLTVHCWQLTLLTTVQTIVPDVSFLRQRDSWSEQLSRHWPVGTYVCIHHTINSTAPKLHHFFLVTKPTNSQTVIKIHPKPFDISCQSKNLGNIHWSIDPGLEVWSG